MVVRNFNTAFFILHEVLQIGDFLQNEQPNVLLSNCVLSFARNFAKSSFSDVAKFSNAELPTIRSQTVNPFSRTRGIVEPGLRHLFITSISSHFFNKTDLERHLFNLLLRKHDDSFLLSSRSFSMLQIDF